MSTTLKNLALFMFACFANVFAILIIWVVASAPARADDFPIVANNLPVTVQRVESLGLGNKEKVRGIVFAQTYVKKDGLWTRDDAFDFEPIWKEAKDGKYAKCAIDDNTLNQGIVHKPNLEIFIAPIQKPTNQDLHLRVMPNTGELAEKIQFTHRDGCLMLKDDEQQPASHGLPAQNLQLELTQGDEKLLDFQVPEQHLAYLLIRYVASGLMMPVPFFIDTVILGTDENDSYTKVHLIFRAQFPVDTKVRKVDINSFYPDQFDMQELSASQMQNNLNRLFAAKRYFARCPYHEKQLYSICALPDPLRLLDEDYFKMLGIERKK